MLTWIEEGGHHPRKTRRGNAKEDSILLTRSTSRTDCSRAVRGYVHYITLRPLSLEATSDEDDIRALQGAKH